MRTRLPAWLLLSILSCACGSDKTTPPVSPGPVTLRISALHPRGGDVWYPATPNQEGQPGTPADPEPVVIGCDRKLGVDVDLDNFNLRAPDACGSALQCGFLAIAVDPPLDYASTAEDAVVSVHGASPSLVLDLTPLEQLGALNGEHLLRPLLLNPNRTLFTSPYASLPEERDLVVTFLAETEEACVSGAGGAGGAGGADAGGAGGAGGASP